MHKLKILVTNDDGYLAQGIQILARALKPLGEVAVVAPEYNASATSSCLTVSRPLRPVLADNGFYYLNGTPCDCIHVALSGLVDFQPDLIVSGINNGANLGDDTIHSGTLGAAQEGYLFRIPSIAFSLVNRQWAYLDDAAQSARELIERLLIQGRLGPGYTGKPWLLNVNIPACPKEQRAGIEITRLGARSVSASAVKAQDPYGEDVYWVGVVGEPADTKPGTDFHAVAHNRISVTPLHADLTDHERLSFWSACYE